MDKQEFIKQLEQYQDKYNKICEKNLKPGSSTDSNIKYARYFVEWIKNKFTHDEILQSGTLTDDKKFIEVLLKYGEEYYESCKTRLGTEPSKNTYMNGARYLIEWIVTGDEPGTKRKARK